MSVYRREEILDRLFAILTDLEGFTTIVRNRGLLTNEKLPGIALLDGDETTTRPPPRSGRAGGMSTVITTLHPQVFILTKTEQPTGKDADGITVGTKLNTHRGVIIKAVASDAQLKALLGPNGEMSYDGAETDLKTGMEMIGSMQLNFSLSCPMNPNA